PSPIFLISHNLLFAKGTNSPPRSASRAWGMAAVGWHSTPLTFMGDPKFTRRNLLAGQHFLKAMTRFSPFSSAAKLPTIHGMDGLLKVFAWNLGQMGEMER